MIACRAQEESDVFGASLEQKTAQQSGAGPSNAAGPSVAADPSTAGTAKGNMNDAVFSFNGSMQTTIPS